MKLFWSLLGRTLFSLGISQDRCYTKYTVPVLIDAVKVKVTQSCLTLCDSVDFSPSGSSVHGILQTIILEWVAISFSRGSSQPRDRTQFSRIAGSCFNL